MMTSRYDRNSSSRKIKIIFVFFVIFYIINYFFGSNIRPAIINSFSFISKKISPLDYVVTKISTNFRDKDNLINANNELETENVRLNDQILNLREILQSIKNGESFLSNGETEILPANAITPNRKILYNNIILDKGYVDGIKEGDLVFVSNLLLVGKVKEVYSNSSMLELFSSNENKMEAFILNSSEEKVEVYASSTDESIGKAVELSSLNDSNPLVEVYGDGAYNFTANISDDVEIKIGEKIYMREFSNYSLGSIYDIQHNDNEKLNKIYIKSNFNPSISHKFYIKK